MITLPFDFNAAKAELPLHNEITLVNEALTLLESPPLLLLPHVTTVPVDFNAAKAPFVVEILIISVKFNVTLLESPP